MDGLVKRYSRDKGFGFIDPLIGKPGAAPAVFFHVSALPKHVQGVPIGARVSFDLCDGPKGPQAVNVRIHTLPLKALRKLPSPNDPPRVRRYEDTDL